MVKAKIRDITMHDALELTDGCRKKLKLSNGKEYRLIRGTSSGNYCDFDDIAYDSKGDLFGVRGELCFAIHSPF